LAAAASGPNTAAKDVALKNPKDFVLIGKPLKRLDTPDKVNGKARLRHRCHASRDEVSQPWPHARYSAARSAPSMTAPPEESRACRRSSCSTIMVAVVGDHMWAAKKGLDALVVTWKEGPNAPSARKTSGKFACGKRKRMARSPKSEGDIAKGLAAGEKLEASFELPFLAHAAMEPLNATVHVKPDSCEIWTGTRS